MLIFKVTIFAHNSDGRNPRALRVALLLESLMSKE
jgi:hypothetical protein